MQYKLFDLTLNKKRSTFLLLNIVCIKTLKRRLNTSNLGRDVTVQTLRRKFEFYGRVSDISSHLVIYVVLLDLFSDISSYLVIYVVLLGLFSHISSHLVIYVVIRSV